MSDAASGYVHSVETGGTVDGPGIRFVIFTSGCPMRCLYCHNPDTRNLKSGKLTSADEMVREAEQYADFIKRSGGGVTVTGGEPLLQQDFVAAIFEGCKKAGLHTALDTSGYLGRKVSERLLAVTDLVLLDIKSFDPKTYEDVTMHRLAPTLEFAELLAERKKPMWVRCVLVPGLTDDLGTYDNLAEYLTRLGNVEKIEVLPFHKMGEPKWKALNIPYTLEATQPPSPELIKQVRDIFAARGFKVV